MDNNGMYRMYLKSSPFPFCLNIRLRYNFITMKLTSRHYALLVGFAGSASCTLTDQSDLSARKEGFHISCQVIRENQYLVILDCW